MPTKRERITRGRRMIEGSAKELWAQKRYIEALAKEPMIEFSEDGPSLTFAQVTAAQALRVELGLPRVAAWDRDHAAIFQSYVDGVVGSDDLERCRRWHTTQGVKPFVAAMLRDTMPL